MRILSFLFLSMLVWADSPNKNRMMSSARCLAMGDACLNSTNDHYTLFYNPAKLVRVPFHFYPLDMQVEFNNEASNAINANKTHPTELRDFSKVANDNFGQWMGGRYVMFPGLTFRNFGLGAFMSGHGLIKPDYKGIEVNVTQQTGAVGGLGLGLFKGILKFGYSATYLDRCEVSNVFGLKEDISLGTNCNEGVGLSHTVGSTLTLPIRYLPSFSVVSRDTGSTVFKKGGGIWTKNPKGAPTTQKQTYDGEFGMMFKTGKESHLDWNTGYRDFLNKNKERPGMRLHTGMELDLFDTLYLRAGVMNGYGTFGIGLNFWGMTYELTTYSQEFTAGFRQAEDRRVLLEFKFGF